MVVTRIFIPFPNIHKQYFQDFEAEFFRIQSSWDSTSKEISSLFCPNSQKESNLREEILLWFMVWENTVHYDRLTMVAWGEYWLYSFTGNKDGYWCSIIFILFFLSFETNLCSPDCPPVLFCSVLVWNKVSFYDSPGTCSVDQASLELSGLLQELYFPSTGIKDHHIQFCPSVLNTAPASQMLVL